jgi:hypothetical protein
MNYQIQIAKTHVEKLCKECKFLAATNVVEFLEHCLPKREVAPLRNYVESEEATYEQAQKERQKQEN